MITYQTMTENVPGHPGTPIRYSPTDVTEKSKTIHKETKFYREEHDQPSYTYRNAPPKNLETKTTVTEKYYHTDGNYPNGHGPGDRSDYARGTTIYRSQSPTVTETHTRTVNRFEEYRSGRSPSSGRYPDKPDTPSYYPRQDTPPHSGTKIYKFSNTTTTVPPNRNADDHEVLLPKPFPTTIQVYPPKPVANGEGPPKKLEDLMASFSDSEVKKSILYYLYDNTVLSIYFICSARGIRRYREARASEQKGIIGYEERSWFCTAYTTAS